MKIIHIIIAMCGYQQSNIILTQVTPILFYLKVAVANTKDVQNSNSFYIVLLHSKNTLANAFHCIVSQIVFRHYNSISLLLPWEMECLFSPLPQNTSSSRQTIQNESTLLMQRSFKKPLYLDRRCTVINKVTVCSYQILGNLPSLSLCFIQLTTWNGSSSSRIKFRARIRNAVTEQKSNPPGS